MKNQNLTKEQQAVLFDKATEAPHSGALLRESRDGSYVCVNCGNKLFDASTKFEAHCGWPSFDRAVEGAVEYLADTSHNLTRTEVVCAQCGGHLGHAFDDGPRETTGERYCINSLAMEFKPK